MVKTEISPEGSFILSLFFQRTTYIHANTLDTFIEITKIQYSDAKRVKGRCNIWNVGFSGEPYQMMSNIAFQIPRKEFSNWKYFNHKVDWQAFRKNQQNQGLGIKS